MTDITDCLLPSLEIFRQTCAYADSVPTLVLPGELVCSPSDVRRIVDGAISHVFTMTTDCLLRIEPSDLYKTHPSRLDHHPCGLLLRPAGVSYLLSPGGHDHSSRSLVEQFEPVAHDLEAQNVDLLLPSLPQEWLLQPSLESYTNKLKHSLDGYVPGFNDQVVFSQHDFKTETISEKCYARIGLMGNPSDAFEGDKTISISLPNFWVEVKIIPNTHKTPSFSSISFLHNPLASNYLFPSLQGLASVSLSDGYHSGDRVLQATTKVFHHYWTSRRAQPAVLSKQGFSLKLFSNIPKQVGLAGSSAIVVATWNALSKFYEVPYETLAPDELASLVLEVERSELGIAAGLQDRVIQAYATTVPDARCIYMDFSHAETPDDNARLNEQGILQHLSSLGQTPSGKFIRTEFTIPPGRYEILPQSHFPEGLWLAYSPDLGSDSGKVHQTVRKRYDAGEQDVVDSVRTLANCAEKARKLLKSGGANVRTELASLFDINFDTRRHLYGDQAIGVRNRLMIEIARECGFAAKFTGSGGAIVGIWRGSATSQAVSLRTEREERFAAETLLRSRLSKEGFVFCRVRLRNQ